MLRFVIALLMLCLFLQANCEVQVQRTSETRNIFVPFYRLYTPSHIRSTAEFTSKNYTYKATGLTFHKETPSYKRLFKLPLIPSCLLNRFADISIRITVGLQSDGRSTTSSSDSDPKFLISDGERGIGFEMRDESIRCRGIQGLTDDVLSSRKTSGGTSYVSPLLPDEFVLNLSPTRRWGSCYYAVDSGMTSPVTYTQSINLNRGLSLDVYREGTNEEYVINYIIVEIHEN